MKNLILVILIIMSVSYRVDALTQSVKNKYPFILLNEDHGVLKEKDLEKFTRKMTYEKFSGKDSGGLVYWQCFPREHIEITLRDMGYTVEEFGKTDTVSDILLTAYKQPSIKHTYVMRRAYPISAYHDIFMQWEKLMKGERYICLAGEFSRHEEKMNNETRTEENSWIYDGMRTNKGSHFYFIN